METLELKLGCVYGTLYACSNTSCQGQPKRAFLSNSFVLLLVWLMYFEEPETKHSGPQ